MKKLKILPSIFMLTLCVAVLGVGVFAVAPTQNTISGSITINSANPEVLITAYGYNSDGTMNTTNPIMAETPARSGINIDLKSLTFDTSACNSEADLAKLDIKVTLRISNPSSKKLGVYFSTAPVADKATAGDVKTTKALTTSTSETDMVKAVMDDYKALSAKDTSNGVVETTITFKLLKFASGDTNPTVNLADPSNQIYLNIEEYQSALDKNTVTLNKNSNNVTVTASTTNTLNNVTDVAITEESAWVPTLTLNNTTYDYATFKGDYPSGEDDDGNYTYDYIDFQTNPVYILDPITLTFTVTNEGSNPIKVNVEGSCGDSNYTVSSVDNGYIPAGQSGKVNIQVTYNIANDEFITTLPENPAGVRYTLEVEELTDEEIAKLNIKDRLVYCNDANDPLNGKYYIEYGTNPYYDGTSTHRQNLRWYIWAYDNAGTKTALGSINPITDTLERTYYFISEYALDYPVGILFQGGYTHDYSSYGGIKTGNKNVNYYAESNVRNYLNGVSSRNSNSYETGVRVSGEDFTYYSFLSGDSVNFYESFGLTSDPLYAQIQGVKMSELYSNIYYNSSGNYGSTDGYSYTPEGVGDHANKEDKFWCLSYGEVFDSTLFQSNTARKAYKLSKGTAKTAFYWWLRSPGEKERTNEYGVNTSGQIQYLSIDDPVAVRPAFAISI